MKHIFRGLLFEAAGAPSGGAAPAPDAAPAPAPVVAPQAPSPAAPTVDTVQGNQGAWAQIMAEAAALPSSAPTAPTGTPAAPPGVPTAPAATTPADPAKPAEVKPPETKAPEQKELPKVTVEDWNPGTPQERYLRSQALREQRAQEQTLKAQYEAQIAALQQREQDASGALNRYRALRAEGKIDEALKVIGEESLEAINKARLQAAGALPKEDPRVTELQKKVQQFEEAERQRQEYAQRQHAEWQAQQERASYVNSVREAMAGAKEYASRGIPELAAVSGVPEFVFGSIQQHPKQPMEWHFAVAEQQFRAIYDSLAPIYGRPASSVVNTDPTPVTSVVNQGQPVAVVSTGGNQPPAVLPQSAAADARGPQPVTGNDDADWQSLLADFRAQSRAG